MPDVFLQTIYKIGVQSCYVFPRNLDKLPPLHGPPVFTAPPPLPTFSSLSTVR